MSDRTVLFPTPSMLLRGYAAGIFPMAESAGAEVLHWFDPPLRALIPLDDKFHISHSLQKTIQQRPYRVTLNRVFPDVMRGCAQSRPGRETTWINREILRLYTALHYRGHAHSVEIWQDMRLVGGLYGVSLGGAFFGESMFSLEKDASKIALVHLTALLRAHRYALLDTQFTTPHLARFGTFEVAREDYHVLLAQALKIEAKKFPVEPDWDYLLGAAFSLQPVSQIS